MYVIIFVNSLRVGTHCVYDIDIVLETLFHMYGIIFVKSLRNYTLGVYDIVLDTLFHMYKPQWLTFYDVVHFCVYDIILNLVCLMRYDEIVYIDLEMYYER
jgi:hypothetical protein